MGKATQLELFGKGQKKPHIRQLEEIAEFCWAGYRAGMSLTEIAARSGIQRAEAAGLALMYLDDDLCAVLRECDTISTFFKFLGASPKIRETVLGLLGEGKITGRLIELARRKQERKVVVRRLKLVGGKMAKRNHDGMEKPLPQDLDEVRVYPGFFKAHPIQGCVGIQLGGKYGQA